MGWGAAVNREPVELTADMQAAFHCWRFCGGYKPELLPMYATIYGLEDAEKMIELLIEIRESRGN